MGKFFGQEIKKTLVKTNNTTVTLPSGSFLKLGGQGYLINSPLVADINTVGLGGVENGIKPTNGILFAFVVFNSGSFDIILSANNTFTDLPSSFVGFVQINESSISETRNIDADILEQSFSTTNAVGSTGSLVPVTNFGTPENKGFGFFTQPVSGIFTISEKAFFTFSIYGLNTDASASFAIQVDKGNGYVTESGQAFSILTGSTNNPNHSTFCGNLELGNTVRFTSFRMNNLVVNVTARGSLLQKLLG